MNNWIKIIIINVLLVAGVIGLTEAIVRYIYPEIVPITEDPELFILTPTGRDGLVPGAEGRSYGAKVVVDERGFRIDPATSTGRQSEEKPVVLVVGDSVTFPVGVEAADGYPYLLDRKYPEHEVVNTAVASFTLEQYIDIIGEQIPLLEPVGIIVGICLNDVVGSTSNLDQETKEIRYSNDLVRWLLAFNNNVFDIKAFLNKYSRAYLLLRSKLRDEPQDYMAYTQHVYENGVAEAIAEKQFARLAEVLRGHDIWLEIFVLPYEYQLRQRDPALLHPQEVLDKAIAKSGLSFTDLYVPVADFLDSEGLESKDIFLFNDGMHFSAKGHKILADLMAEKLDELNPLAANP